METELDAILSENADLCAQCEQLEEHLVRVVKTLEQNLNLCIARNKGTEVEIHQLEHQIELKESLIKRIKSLFADLSHCGLDVTFTETLNLEYYLQLFEEVLPQPIPGCDQFDPTVYHVVSTTPFFRECDGNESFLEKCEELMASIAELSDGNPLNDASSDDEDYEQMLREEQSAFQRDFAHKSVVTKRLLDEHGKLRFRIEKSRSPRRPFEKGWKTETGSEINSFQSSMTSLFI
jgi:hypothetical protein